MGVECHGCWRLKTTGKTARRGKRRLEKWRLGRARLLQCEEEGAGACAMVGRGGGAPARWLLQPWSREEEAAGG
jgi:hypothetical protein